VLPVHFRIVYDERKYNSKLQGQEGEKAELESLLSACTKWFTWSCSHSALTQLLRFRHAYRLPAGLRCGDA
jgi:hypothetical protein